MKVGDIVIVTTRSKWSSTVSWCRITKVTAKGTLTVETLRDHGKVTTEHRPVKRDGKVIYRNLRLATAYEIAIRQWWNDVPSGRAVWAGQASLGVDYEAEVRVRVDIDDKDLRPLSQVKRVDLTIAELQAVAEWMRRRPQRAAAPAVEEDDDAED